MSAPNEDQAREIATLKVQVRELREFHAGDLVGNSCFWIFLIALFGIGIVVLFAWPYRYEPWHHPMNTVSHGNASFYMKTGPMPIHGKGRQRHTRASCTVGETWDPVLELCAPSFRAPLAIDAAIMNSTMQACDSFYESMCGRYMTSHVNENRAFSYGWRRIRARMRLMVANATTSVITPAQAMYRACLARGSPASQKESRLEFHHLVEHVVNPIRSHADLPTALGRLARMGYTGPFALSMERHPLEPRVLPFWSPDGFPDPLLDEGRLFQLLQAWRGVTEYNSIQETHLIEGVLRVSRLLAMHRRADAGNVTNYADYVSRVFPGHLISFMEWTPDPTSGGQWSWERYFQALDGNALRFEPTTLMWAPDAAYLRWFIAQEGWRTLSVTDWRSWIEFSILYNGNDFDPALPDNVYFRQHDVLGPVGPGARFYHRLPRSHQQTRGSQTHHGRDEAQERCLSLTEHMLPGWVASSYLERWMPERVQVQGRVRGIVQRLLSQLQERVRKTPWLSAENRERLADKVGSIMVRVIEPEEWHPEPFGPSLASDRHDHNMNLVRRYRVQRNLALWHKDNGASWWSRAAIAFFAMPLTEVNAYYSGPSNSITILAGVLQSPFFNLQYGDVSQWAILGSIVGHELSHALDHHGLHWDREGNFVPVGILGSEGMARFYKEIECVIREYGPAPAGCEDANAHYGNSTIGEDLADLTGISLAYEALFSQQSIGTQGVAPTVGDKQHFFMVLAQAFCETYDQEHRCAAVANDVHAVAEFRIDRTFRNMPGWRDVFGCHEDEKDGICRVY